jgi:hypothetical protein
LGHKTIGLRKIAQPLALLGSPVMKPVSRLTQAAGNFV